MNQFFDSLNEYLLSENKKASIYIFGGGALCLHDLREKTNDFDSATIMDKSIEYHNQFEAIKNYCLPSIGLSPVDEKFHTTFNDISDPKFKKEGFQWFNNDLKENKKYFQFNTTKSYSNLKVIIPSKEYLLFYTLINMKTDHHKIDLVKIDCDNLIKDLKLNNKNKNNFLNAFSEHPEFDYITNKLTQVLTIIENKNLAIYHINDLRKKQNKTTNSMAIT